MTLAVGGWRGADHVVIVGGGRLGRRWRITVARVDKKLTAHACLATYVLIFYYCLYTLWSSVHRIGGTVSANNEGPPPVLRQHRSGKVREIGGRGDRDGPVQI